MVKDQTEIKFREILETVMMIMLMKVMTVTMIVIMIKMAMVSIHGINLITIHIFQSTRSYSFSHFHRLGPLKTHHDENGDVVHPWYQTGNCASRLQL